MEATGHQLAKITNGIVILVDYSQISSCSYSRCVREIVPSVGYYLAEIIEEIGWDLNNIEIIGHSTGAHIAGYAGAALNGNIKRITGCSKAMHTHASWKID